MAFQCGHPDEPSNWSSNGKLRPRCKACHRERERRARAADPERTRRLAAERMRKHRGGLKGHRNARKTHCPSEHEYTPENTFLYEGQRQCKACRVAHGAKWRAVNTEYVTRSNRAHYAANRESRLAASRAWDRNNRERSNELSRLKKHRRRAAGVLTAADWESVLELYGRNCLACGSDAPPTIDHVVPTSKGGSNTADNVQPLCGPCNSSKGTKTIDYRQTPAVLSRS